VLWSAWEARQFSVAAAARTSSTLITAQRHRPENVMLMNHAYGLFAKLPAYFSNGVMDPRSEFRFLDPNSLAPVPADSMIKGAEGTFEGEIDANPGILDLKPTFKLAPGKRYELKFNLPPRDYEGILQLVGTYFFREYALPHSGERLAFGTAAENAKSLWLWTTADASEEVQLRFIPTGAGKTPTDFMPFAQFEFRTIDPSAEPIQVESLVPLRARVHPSQPAWLETPRMFAEGYVAKVNHQPVAAKASKEGLVMIPLDKEATEVELRYRGPVLLRVAYWGTLLAWTAFLSYLLRFARGRNQLLGV